MMRCGGYGSRNAHPQGAYRAASPTGSTVTFPGVARYASRMRLSQHPSPAGGGATPRQPARYAARTGAPRALVCVLALGAAGSIGCSAEERDWSAATSASAAASSGSTGGGSGGAGGQSGSAQGSGGGTGSDPCAGKFEGDPCGAAFELRCCGGACVDTSRDPKNCGGCGIVCPREFSPDCLSFTTGGKTTGWCSCTSDAQCPAGEKCILPYFGACSCSGSTTGQCAPGQTCNLAIPACTAPGTAEHPCEMSFEQINACFY